MYWRSNYYELNNYRPIVWEGSDGAPVATCTDLLINGERWDQDIARKIGTRQGGPGKNSSAVVGKLGRSVLLSSIIVEGNSHNPPGHAQRDGASNCDHYAAVTAVSATAVSLISNHLVSYGGPPMLSAALLRLGTDTTVYAAGDFSLTGNTPLSSYDQYVGQAYQPARGEYFEGWWPLIELLEPTRSNAIAADTAIAGNGELPYHSIYSPEIPQRNRYDGAFGIGNLSWHELDGVAFPGASGIMLSTLSRNGRETVAWPGNSAGANATVGAVIQKLNLDQNPEIAGKTIHFSMEAAMPAGWRLALLIDPGTGVWQMSNASSVMCMGDGSSFRSLGADCDKVRPTGNYVMRSYQAQLLRSGTARFALLLVPTSDRNEPPQRPVTGRSSRQSVCETPCLVPCVSGIAIAQIGARWHSLKTDDVTGRPCAQR